ncbi:unnamed protein product [Miscanthus lutarioriparius]|uniref:Uncharacterized protein n=1 Tax=Miscanthus lutarioriparius TaxID=422564 RepID=A0A811SLG3_9POAL|nr:unnamed protein product [Miscanthus lutarioriparius]
MWLLFWGQATKEIGRLAFGEGCAVVTTAYKVVSVAVGVTFVLVLPFSVLLLALMMPSRRRRRRQRPLTLRQRRMQPVDRNLEQAIPLVLAITLSILEFQRLSMNN